MNCGRVGGHGGSEELPGGVCRECGARLCPVHLCHIQSVLDVPKIRIILTTKCLKLLTPTFFQCPRKMAITFDWVNFSLCVIQQNNQKKVSFLECFIRLDQNGLVFEIFLLVFLGGSHNLVVVIIHILWQICVILPCSLALFSHLELSNQVVMILVGMGLFCRQ